MDDQGHLPAGLQPLISKCVTGVNVPSFAISAASPSLTPATWLVIAVDTVAGSSMAAPPVGQVTIRASRPTCTTIMGNLSPQEVTWHSISGCIPTLGRSPAVNVAPVLVTLRT
ncbi:uncharacterized protein LOC143281092 [Babylonia areolata]|uniref:uncharacterized protein LOC143281092 n=1 Tax=Babylonia areolata TaxID=304850 RepID=UPI003FD59CE0